MTKVTRLKDEYMHRGVEFRRDDSVSPGYCGRYKIGGFRNGRVFTTRKQVLAYIDKELTSA